MLYNKRVARVSLEILVLWYWANTHTKTKKKKDKNGGRKKFSVTIPKYLNFGGYHINELSLDLNYHN